MPLPLSPTVNSSTFVELQHRNLSTACALPLSWQQLKHDNIVNLIEVFRRKSKLHLVFEYVERTILEDLERNPDGMDPIETKKCLWQLLRSIDYCHAHNIIHRDIKPENLLISRNGACVQHFSRILTPRLIDPPSVHISLHVATSVQPRPFCAPPNARCV